VGYGRMTTMVRIVMLPRSAAVVAAIRSTLVMLLAVRSALPTTVTPQPVPHEEPSPDTPATTCDNSPA